jgi:hypothetical protein
MPADPLESFYANFVKALHEGNAAIFAGAGLSRSSGYVDWRGLLKGIARDLDLDIDKETDLIAVAQYHENKFGNRTEINRAIIEEFTKEAKLNENHRLIANLPITTIWTTNYDALIEEAYKDARKRVDAKISPKNLVNQKPGRVVTVYKMHGDASQPHDAVITKEDYETYDAADKRQLFSIKLKGDLVDKMFLFLGFSFTDPNIEYILSRIRALLGKDQGIHYCIMRSPEKPKPYAGRKKATYEYDKTKLDHRISDLKRYGIRPLLIDKYSQITEILDELNRRSHLKDVFVSGSAANYDPLGQDRVEELSGLIGRTIIEKGCNLVSGIGLGIGSHVIIGALESLYGTHYEDQGDRLSLRPFPQTAPHGMTLPEFWEKYRTEMISKAGACIFICGNKQVHGKIIESDGVVKEFEIARSLGKYPIPVGATGHAARTIWDIVVKDLDKFFPGGAVKTHFDTLGNEKKTNQELANAVFAILKQVNAF